jgi:hypothetical protein
MLTFKEYKQPEAENDNVIVVKNTIQKFSELTQKEKRLKIIGIFDNLYTQDKVYYTGIKQEEVEALVDTEFLNVNASTITDMFKNIHTKCIVQDFGIKQRRILGIESDNEVKSKLLSVTKEIGQSRIVLTTNYGLRLMKDAFDELSRIYK